MNRSAALMIRTLAACLLLTAVATVPVAAGKVTFNTIALSGEPALASPTSVNYLSLGAPVLNRAGQTAFRASLTGAGVNTSNDVGIFSNAAGVSGKPHLIAREGAAAPGTASGVRYRSFDTLVLNNAGQTAFVATLTGTGVVGNNNRGVFLEAADSLGSPGLLARKGDPAPGTAPGVRYNSFSSPSFNEAGQIAYRTDLTSNVLNISDDRGIFFAAAGTPGPVAKAGDPAPGTVDGANYNFFSPPVLNETGQIAFRASITGTGVDGTNNSGIFSGAADSIGLLARTGDPAPGTATGVNYLTFVSEPALNRDGQTAFRASLTGTGVTNRNNSAIFAGAAGSIDLIARTGDAAPGSVDVNYLSFVDDPVLNGAGQTAFLARLTGTGVNATNNEGIFLEDSGSSSLVARTGERAPGTAAGVHYFTFGAPALNGSGQIAFQAFLAGTGVDSNNDRGIWATDSDGLLTLVLREGDLFDIDDDPFVDDFRTVRSFDFVKNTGNEDGGPSAFNDQGQLAFAATFTDGSSGIFIANTAGRMTLVPEPTTVSMLMIIALGLALVRTSRRAA